MNDGALLLRAVLNEPLDDAARLVYADWLDENATCDADRARAEYIRYCIKPVVFGSYPSRYDCGTSLANVERDHEQQWRGAPILAREREWLGPWWRRRRSGWHGPAWQPRWTRGFVSCVTIGRADLMRCGARLFGSQPITVLYLNPSGRSPIARRDANDPESVFWAGTEEEYSVIAWGRQQAGLRALPDYVARVQRWGPRARWPWVTPPS